VWLNSPGGDVFAASQIYTMLKSHNGKVTVKIDGIAANTASLMLKISAIAPKGVPINQLYRRLELLKH